MGRKKWWERVGNSMGLTWKIGFGKENGWFFRVYFVSRGLKVFYLLSPLFFLSLCTSTKSYSLLLSNNSFIVCLGFWGVACWCSLVSYPVMASLGLSVFGILAPQNSILFFLCYSTSCFPSKKKPKKTDGLLVSQCYYYDLLYSLLILLIPFSWAFHALPDPCFLVGINLLQRDSPLLFLRHGPGSCY